MNVRVDFADIIKVAVGYSFRLGQLLVFVKEDVHVPFALQVF